MHMNDEFKTSILQHRQALTMGPWSVPQDRAGPMTPALPYGIEDGYAPSLDLKDDHHLGLHTPYVAVTYFLLKG
ncbi:uncharacterized protein N7525_008183 [Penicillium rubens]|jgi:hypothetical protein|uniref:uncharacterized protein n=1 Tax=Penicillium rubens TaxID=1108849 RepID=UPI002A5A0B32|nr:uncharacterized protein N7525_008183 [Penicillium rubens]KAJ5829930.1 hypothetical protein N7525_008183 [Penicillium rubens]